MDLKTRIGAFLGIERFSPKSTEQEEFIYKPSEWEDRDPKRGANRVIRFGGGTRTCVFPVPTDPRYFPSYMDHMADYISKREEFNRAVGSVSIPENIQTTPLQTES